MAGLAAARLLESSHLLTRFFDRPTMFPARLFAIFLVFTSLGAHAATPMQPDVAVSPTGMHLVINLPQTRLFVYQDGVLSEDFPVAVGKMLTRTPVGEYTVTGIYRNPAWHVPKSIQEEQRRAGKPVQTVVPPGPDNPLGPVFIRFGEAKLGLGIHGTNAPSSVPGFRSHGCVRMKSDQVLPLSYRVPLGTPVTVTYQTVLLGEDAAGELWLSALRDRYQHKDDALPKLADTLLSWQQQNQTPMFGKRVDTALKVRSGKPVCLSCRAPADAQPAGTLTAVQWLRDAAPAAQEFAAEPAEPVMEPQPELPLNTATPIPPHSATRAAARQPA